MSVREQNATAQVVYLACCAADAAVAMTASTHLAHVTVFTNLPFIMSLPGDALIDLMLEVMSVLPSVRPSTKFFFDFDLIWCVGRPRQYATSVTSTQSKVKVKVTGLLNFRKLHFSRSTCSAILAYSSKLMVDDDSMPPCLQLDCADFRIFF